MRKDLAVFLFALLLCLRAFAQTTGAIEGVITDSTGSAVPAAAVKLTNTGTGVVTSTTTNSSGFFLADGLAVGVYDLAREAINAGRKEYIRLLELYMECEAQGEWPAYNPDVREITNKGVNIGVGIPQKLNAAAL